MSWALVTTGSNREHIVTEKLKRSGLAVRFFRARKLIVQRGKVHRKLVPAFSRYLFVSVTSTHSLQPQWRTMIENGAYPVSCGGTPVEVSDITVDAQASRGVDDIFLDIEECGKFKAGDRVRVVGTQNLVFGSIGIYQYPLDGTKSCVLLPWFSGLIPTAVDDHDLALATEKSRSKRRSRNRRRGRDRSAVEVR